MDITSHLFTKIILSLYIINVGYYGYLGDYGRSGYWLCAAGITICATWLVK